MFPLPKACSNVSGVRSCAYTWQAPAAVLRCCCCGGGGCDRLRLLCPALNQALQGFNVQYQHTWQVLSKRHSDQILRSAPLGGTRPGVLRELAGPGLPVTRPHFKRLPARAGAKSMYVHNDTIIAHVASRERPNFSQIRDHVVSSATNAAPGVTAGGPVEQ